MLLWKAHAETACFDMSSEVVMTLQYFCYRNVRGDIPLMRRRLVDLAVRFVDVKLLTKQLLKGLS